MKFGLMYELQLPRPWRETAEQELVQNALAEVELADKLGFDSIWANEHHFLEEYAHSSAPEVFLAACAARTKSVRIGHAVVLSPPNFNAPARVAERIAMLDLVSNGRVQWGTGESASRVELEGFSVDPATKKAMWAEATEQTANMLAMTPYPGFDGQFFSMPSRNVVPKPVQRPHPPLWLACSRRETIHAAARHGVGALAFAFIDPSEAAKWAQEYYDIIKSDACVPIGHTVNANIAMTTGFSCHADGAEARRRGAEGFKFFGYALGHYYVYGQHQPGETDIWARFESVRDELPDVAYGNGIGSPEEIIACMKLYQDAGVDEVIFIQQSGRTSHEHIVDSINIFSRDVMPVFREGAAERAARKQAELAPYIEAALQRKQWMAPVTGDRIPIVPAFGRSIASEPSLPSVVEESSNDKVAPGTTHHAAAGFSVLQQDPAEKLEATQK